VVRAVAIPVPEVERVLDAAGIEARVVRPPSTSGWRGPLEGAPVLEGPQLLDGGDLEPLLECDQGVLVGSVGHVVVVADPDVLETHGLGRGGNARVAVGAAFAVLDEGRPLVVDETLHGHRVSPGIWSELFRPPLSLVLLQCLLVLGGVLWAGTGRFGAPAPAPPALEPGKRLLVGNTAQLLRLGGHAGPAVERYLRTTVHDVARAVHAPPGLGADRLREFLEELGAARGLEDGPGAFERAAREVGAAPSGRGARAVALARRVHRWREEMTHGRRGDPGP
jgi:hypothetical protein